MSEPRARWIDQPATASELRSMAGTELLRLFNAYCTVEVESWDITEQQYSNAYATGRLAHAEIMRRLDLGREPT